jgi:hypothetical protein
MENADKELQQNHRDGRDFLGLGCICGFCLFKELRKLRKTVEEITRKIMSKITDFQATVQTQFDAIGVSLDNISADEANLAKQITDLQTQIANGGSTLTSADQAALDLVVSNATSLAAKTKTTADNVPDLPSPPVV